MNARSRSSASKWVLLVLIVAAAIGAWQWYRKQSQDSPLEYKTTAVTRDDITQTVTANGQLSAVKNVTVGSQVSGIITKLYVDFNSRAVDEGQTVAASFNAPTLFNIANDLRYMRIEAMVSEADVGGVREGQDVKFTVDAFPGRTFPGRITQVRYAPVTNQNVVNYTS